MLKILLLSDMHIGAVESSDVPNSIRIATFKKICALAIDHDLLIIAGDLLGHPDITKNEMDYISQEFKNLRDNGVTILYTPGEHEHYDDGTIPSWIFQCNATHVFDGVRGSNPYVFQHKKQNVIFYGLPAIMHSDEEEIIRTGDDGFHIGLFHALLIDDLPEEESEVRILDKDVLKIMNLDFYALGHHHFFKLFKSQNRIIAAYPGSPEALTEEETDERYVLSIHIKDNEIQQIKRMVVNSITMKLININCADINSQEYVFKSLEDCRSPKTVVHLNLKGIREFPLDAGKLESMKKGFFNCVINDASFPTMGAMIQLYQDENSLRGAFFTFLKNTIDRDGLPPDIDDRSLAMLLDHITRKGTYLPEEWLC